MAIKFPGQSDDLNLVTTQPDVVPLSQADISDGPATRAHTDHHRDLGEAVVTIQNLMARHDHDHSGDTSSTNKPGMRKGNKLKQENTHEQADTDESASSIHHTLGWGTYQSAPGGNTDSRLNDLSDKAQLLQDLTQHSPLRVFDTFTQMNTWRSSASEKSLSPTNQVVAYVKERDSFYLMVSSASPAVPIMAGLPVGSVFMFAGGKAPSHALRCDGSLHSASAYPELFSVIGNTYGGDLDQFRVPNLNGRVPVGRDTSDTDFSVRGRTGGSKTHAHTEGNLQAAIGESNGDRSVISYLGRPVGARAPKTTTRYSVKATSLAVTSRSFDYHTGVYGTTATASSLQPYTVVDYYIVAR